jgi:deazaflavin-dependent oxidoreductase (nitroreductase family)
MRWLFSGGWRPNPGRENDPGNIPYDIWGTRVAVPHGRWRPLGFNGLITVRGRNSGLPRTTPVAIIEVSGMRWAWCPWVDVHWVRNLRAAGRATISVRRRREELRAIQLDAAGRGKGRAGPDVPIGWPNRFLVLTYVTWLAVAAWTILQR